MAGSDRPHSNSPREHTRSQRGRRDPFAPRDGFRDPIGRSDDDDERDQDRFSFERERRGFEQLDDWQKPRQQQEASSPPGADDSIEQISGVRHNRLRVGPNDGEDNDERAGRQRCAGSNEAQRSADENSH